MGGSSPEPLGPSDSSLRPLQTCLKFFPKRPQDSKWIRIRPLAGCYSKIGRSRGNGAQDLSLDADCVEHGTVLHELMHAAGFFHEQSRADRDRFVEIVPENVEPKMLSNFDKMSLERIKHLG